jgi:TetR/AcrR family transcriptional regulator
MAAADAAGTPAVRRWGDERALLDDEEARRRLIEAAARCILRRGSANIRVAEVSDEAGVARSTLYRYFATREELILALIVRRMDAAFERIVRALPHPHDAAASLVDLILEPIGLVDGNALNEALFSTESTGLVTSLALSSEAIVDVMANHFGPLVEQWQADGALHDDLDGRETVRWLNSVALMLLAPPWRHRSNDAKRTFLEHYVVRALVPTSS